jgi:hypothetical protein
MIKLSIPTTVSTAQEQPGTTITLDRTGLATVNATFGVDASALSAVLASLPGSFHPRFAWAGFNSARCTESEGDLLMIAVTYQGDPSGSTFEFDPAAPEPAAEPPRFSLSFATTEEPILTAKRYESLEINEKEAILAIISTGDLDAANPFGTPYRDAVTSDLGIELLEKIADGTTSVKTPRLVWRAGYTSEKIPSNAFKKRGKILPAWGPAPALNPGENWLLEGGEIVQAGSTNTIDLVWIASGPGGWDPDLYS